MDLEKLKKSRKEKSRPEAALEILVLLN